MHDSDSPTSPCKVSALSFKLHPITNGYFWRCSVSIPVALACKECTLPS